MSNSKFINVWCIQLLVLTCFILTAHAGPDKIGSSLESVDSVYDHRDGLIQPGAKLKIRTDLFELHNFPGWYKPRNDITSFKGNSRLVVKLYPDGKAVLNPQDESDPAAKFELTYHVINLRDLSMADAETLWGPSRGKKMDSACVLTFDLVDEFRRAEKDLYHLDLKFDNNKIVSYRLRGINITKPEWVPVS